MVCGDMGWPELFHWAGVCTIQRPLSEFFTPLPLGSLLVSDRAWLREGGRVGREKQRHGPPADREKRFALAQELGMWNSPRYVLAASPGPCSLA